MNTQQLHFVTHYVKPPLPHPPSGYASINYHLLHTWQAHAAVECTMDCWGPSLQETLKLLLGPRRTTMLFFYKRERPRQWHSKGASSTRAQAAGPPPIPRVPKGVYLFA